MSSTDGAVRQTFVLGDRPQRLVCTPLPRGATLPRCLSGPGPAARWPLPLGPPWTPSTASSSPTQETAPGSSPTFNPRVLSSSSPSHLRDSGCPYSPPLCTKLCEDAEWQCPGVEDTNPPPGVQRSRRPADSLALMWLPPAPPRFERRAQQLEGPLGRVSSLAAVNHAGGELAGSLHLRRPRKLVTSVKVGLDTRVCYPAAMDESMCGSPNPTGPWTYKRKADFSLCASPISLPVE